MGDKYFLLYANDYADAIFQREIAVVKAPSYTDAVMLLKGEVLGDGDEEVSFEIAREKLASLSGNIVGWLEPERQEGDRLLQYTLKQLPLIS